LIASIDAARSYMASKEGAEAMERTYELAAYARQEIHKIPGFIDEGREHFLPMAPLTTTKANSSSASTISISMASSSITF
jgi:arginine/lysine/ornithine decarboxylase